MGLLKILRRRRDGTSKRQTKGSLKRNVISDFCSQLAKELTKTFRKR